MKPVRLGVIGAGEFAGFCLDAYRDLRDKVSILAVADQDLVAANRLAERFSIREQFSSGEELIQKSSADLIIILVPPKFHHSLAKSALMANKHVLVEKPIAFTLKQGEELINLARSRGRQLSSNLVLRYHPFHQQLKNWVKDKTFGHLRQIATTALLAKYPEEHWYWDPKVSGGFFLNTYCHFLDLYPFIMGKKPVRAGHFGDTAIGQTIYQEFRDGLATLTINLRVANEQEWVESNYIFDHAVIRTYDWLPSKMEVITATDHREILADKDKALLYREILAAILEEMVNNINQPKHHQNPAPLEALSWALMAQ